MPSCTDIPTGRENTIARQALAQLWGCSDREVRKRISDLRKHPSSDGLVILSSARTPRGYWRSSDQSELEAFIAENEARARSTFVAVKEARNLLSEIRLCKQFPSHFHDA